MRTTLTPIGPDLSSPEKAKSMRDLKFPAFVFCVLLLLAQQAVAQLPVASGRQIALSNSAWKLFIPDTYEHRSGEVADILVHFHGDPQTMWNNALYAELNTVVVTVNYSGLSSAYSGPFSNATLFQSLLNEALTKVRQESDFSNTLKWDQIGVSSFSAGYGAVREILKSPTYRNNIDALLAADSLYATTAGDGTPLDSQMVDYKTFASLAQSEQKTFIFSHSQVLTYTYENTMETGDELMQHLGISPAPISMSGLGTLDFYRHAKSGNFELWGALGADGDAHLEHLRYIGQFLADLPLAHLGLTGDFDEDGDVDGDDFLKWQRGQSPDPFSDSDLADWEANYGMVNTLLATSTGVPEPGAMALFCLGVLLVNSRFRDRSNRRPIAAI